MLLQMIIIIIFTRRLPINSKLSSSEWLQRGRAQHFEMLTISNDAQLFEVIANLLYDFIFVVIWTHHTTFNVNFRHNLATLIKIINSARVTQRASSISGLN